MTPSDLGPGDARSGTTRERNAALERPPGHSHYYYYHRCQFVDAITNERVAEVIMHERYQARGMQPMRRGRWYRCLEACGRFLYIRELHEKGEEGDVVRVELWPNASLEDVLRIMKGFD